LGSERAQYVGFYSSAKLWVGHRADILDDQLEIFRRGVTSAPRPNCCNNPFITQLGFTEDQHKWMVPYPTAFVIPFEGGGQRSDAEANRMVQWLLDNGIQVETLDGDLVCEGQTFPAGSYVVWMDQALRGLAYTTLSAGQDVSERITQLYAPPGAWSHGLLWGADAVEIPSDPAFSATTTPISAPNPLAGGLAPGAADWYALTLRGVGEVRAILDLLRSGVEGEVAEEPFNRASAGQMPAGTLLFDAADATALSAAGLSAGVFFEPVLDADKPDDTTQLDEAPRIAMLAGGTARNDTLWSLEQIFGDDVDVVTAGSLQNAATDPLLDYDVIYNAGQAYPDDDSPIAQDRLNAFFAGGGGYIGTSQSAANFAFLNTGGLLTSSLSQASDAAGGGIAIWANPGVVGPLTGGFPGLPVPAVEHHVLLGGSERCLGGRAVPERHGRPVPRRAMAGSGRGRGRRSDDRPRRDDRRQPLPRAGDEPVLTRRRRTRMGAHRPGRAVVEPDGRVDAIGRGRAAKAARPPHLNFTNCRRPTCSTLPLSRSTGTSSPSGRSPSTRTPPSSINRRARVADSARPRTASSFGR
jgi:hypothetical protein